MKLYNSVYCLRHLKTYNNNLQIISGQNDSDIVDTDYPSFDLAQFDKIYCSPAQRCIKSLSMLDNRIALDRDIAYDNRLLERNMGCLQGMSRESGMLKYPDLFNGRNFNLFKTPPGGEEYIIFKKRVMSFIDECLCASNGLDILVCSHNQTLKLIRLIILERNITNQSWMEFSFANGEILRII